MRALGVLAWFLMLTLAGCLSDDGAGDGGAETDEGGDGAGLVPPGEGLRKDALSQDAYGILDMATAYFPASLDGIALHARIHLPDGEGPWPTIIRHSPYNKHVPEELDGGLVGVEAAAALVNRYVPKGYAVVVSDVRGTGNSEGCMDNMGYKEQGDAYDVVEWVANQSWSNGKIGMHGVSYEGTTPHQALIVDPPSLDTVVTIAGVTNQWRNIFQNGVPYMGRWYHINYAVNEGGEPPTDADRGAQWALNVAAGACDQEALAAEITPTNYRLGLYNDFWVERNYTIHAPNVTVPILYSQGFIDRAVNPSEAVHWFNDIPAPKKGFFHQGGHIYPPRDDYFDTELAWFDHWLKDMDTGVMETPQVEIQLNDGRLRTTKAWPPAPDAVTWDAFFMGPGGLSKAAPEEASHVLAAPQAYNGGSCTTAAPVDDLLVAAADAPLRRAYNTPAFENDTLLSGSPWMHLLGSVDADHTYWLMDLYHVNSAGAATWISEGRFNAHLRDGFDQSNPVTPGEPTWSHFRFEPREYLVPAGEHLRIVVQGFECGAAFFFEPASLQTLHFGPEGSWFEVPVVKDPVFWDAPDWI